MPPVRILNPGSVPLAVLTEEELLTLAQNLAAARIFSAAAFEAGKDAEFADPDSSPTVEDAVSNYWNSLSPIDHDAWLHVARQAYVTLAHISGCDIDFITPPDSE